MSIAHLDLIGGAAGNMLLGAFVDAGVPAERLEAAMRSVVRDGWTLHCSRVTKAGVAAVYVDVEVPGEDERFAERGAGHHGTSLAEVLEILERSALTASQKSRARDVYVRLAHAEAKVHGTTADAIHFHEVGAIDAILDVAGAVAALDLLGVERLTCSRIPVGHGVVTMAHGTFPNPPPVTLELLRGLPVYGLDVEAELVTPTAAAIIATLCERGTTLPEMVPERIGYGAGTRDLSIPNVTRVTVGHPAAAPNGEVRVLEANIDDMSPQHFELAVERLFAAGALDVWYAPIAMKKGRPAVLLSAIAPVDREAACAQTMLRETSTIGVRVRSERRYVMERTIETVDTPYGQIRVKSSRLDGIVRRTPEYDDLARIARERNRPLSEIVESLDRHLGAGRP